MRTRVAIPAFVLLASVALVAGARADFLVSSSNTNQVLRYDQSGQFVSVFASGNGLQDPEGITQGPDGNVYVSSGTTGQVLRYSGATGAFLGVAASGNGLSGPLGLISGADGSLYVSSYFNNQVLRFNESTGAFLGVAASGGGLNGPDGVACGPDHNLYVASTAVNPMTGTTPDQVLEYNGTTGAFIKVFASGDGHQGFTGLAFGPDGNLYVSGIDSGNVLRYSGPLGVSPGSSLGVFASGGGLAGPLGLTFGSDGSLYASGFNSNNVVHYSSTGSLIGTFIPSGSGGLNGPSRSIFLRSVPEPSSLTLSALGLGLMLGTWRRVRPSHCAAELTA